MKHGQIRLLCISGVLTAVIFVFTAYLHIPSHTGYTHVGDAFVYLAGCLLPAPYSVFAGAVGGALADLLSGFQLWLPGTAVIKALTVLLFTCKRDKLLCGRNLLALLPAAALCTGGYYLYEVLLTQNFYAPLYGIPSYLTQSALSSALFFTLGKAFDKWQLKKNLFPAPSAFKKSDTLS